MRAWTWGYDLYQPDRNVIGHLYIPSGSPLRPVFWTTDWGKRWPCQYRSLLRVQEQLGIHRELTPRESLGNVDLEDWGRYAPGAWAAWKARWLLGARVRAAVLTRTVGT